MNLQFFKNNDKKKFKVENFFQLHSCINQLEVINGDKLEKVINGDNCTNQSQQRIIITSGITN